MAKIDLCGKKQNSVLEGRTAVSIDMEFHDIEYVVPQTLGKKRVIKGVSGQFRAGELTAIMGPSGAGKSSLLNILTGFKEAKGTIKCSGPLENRKGAKQHTKYSCYILQEDCLDPLFTVEETMHYAADLKLGKTVSQKYKEALISDILTSLYLLPCRNTRCGMISGGQKKRLSVALELIGNPSMIILDEPTTGLDSQASQQVVSVLKRLAQEGRNIICTIHQPSASLFELFDFVYVMAEGKCVYQGSSKHVVSYLASHGLNCPQYHNPADYLLEVTNGDYGNFTDKLEIRGIETKWRDDSKERDRNSIRANYEEFEEIPTKKPKSPAEIYKLWILLKQYVKKMYRDWTISSLKILLHLCVGVVLGLTYLNAGNDASRMIQNFGFLMIGVVYVSYTSLMPGVLKFPSEINILKKEKFNNWYKLSTYYMACLLVDMPLQLFFVTAYVSGSFTLTAQQIDVYGLSKVLLIFFLTAAIASSIGVFYGTLVNPINGTFFGAISLCVMLVFAGFLILFGDMPYVMYLFSYGSFLAWSLESLMDTIYDKSRKALPCPEDVEFCLYTSPQDLLSDMGMDKVIFWRDMTILFVMFVSLRIIAYCTLKKALKK